MNSTDKFTLVDAMHRVGYFALCGLIILGAYLVLMLPLNTFARELFLPDANGETAFRALPEHFWFILYSFAYILPLYFLYFRRNATFKITILRLTEEKLNYKDVFWRFTAVHGKYDLIIYTAYTALMLLPFSYAFDNPAILICIQAGIFYLYPIPRIVSYLLGLLLFAVQYYVCLFFAVRYWDKHRIRPRQNG